MTMTDEGDNIRSVIIINTSAVVIVLLPVGSTVPPRIPPPFDVPDTAWGRSLPLYAMHCGDAP